MDYTDTLDALLKNVEDESGESWNENKDNLEMDNTSLLARHLLVLIKSLINLEEKSRMYEGNAMQYIFLMNNILYIVQKVKDSWHRNFLADNWIKKQRGQIR